MTEQFRVKLTIDGDARGAKVAATEAAQAVTFLSGATKDATTSAQTHILAVAAQAAAADRLKTAQGSVVATILQSANAQKAALAGAAPLIADAEAATRGLGMSMRAMSASEAAVSGSTRALSVDMAKLAAVDMQVRAATDAAVKALIDQSHAFERLKAEMAPAVTAEQRFAAAQAQVTAAVRAGLVTQTEANAVIDQARVKYAALPGVVDRVSSSMAGGMNNSRNFAMQMSQVAQHGAITGNYLGALAIQLPDMALGFGGVAIAASMVATVALPLLISAFGNGASAADVATQKNDAYAASLDAVRSDMSAATDLQSRYAAAVVSGSAETVRALQNEARIRKALLLLNLNDARQLQLETQASVDAATAELEPLQRKYDELIGQQRTFAEQDRRGTLPLDAQPGRVQVEMDILLPDYSAARDLLRRLGLEFDLTKAKIEGDAEAITTITAALDSMANGIAPITPLINTQTVAFRNLSGSASELSSTIAGINTSNLVLMAQNAALAAGATEKQAEVAGKVAAEAEKLAPALNSSVPILQSMAQAQLQAYEAALNTHDALVATGEALNADTAAAVDFTSQLAAALGIVQGIRATISGLNFSNIGIEAENAALRAGKSAVDARIIGTIASEAAQLAPVYNAGDNPAGRDAANDASNTLAAHQTQLQRQAAAQADNAKLLAELAGVGGGAAGGGGAAQTDAIQRFLENQQQELDLLRETDPVQKEMLRNRALLAGATDVQRAAVEAAIRTGIEETAQIEGTQAAWDAMGSSALQALEDILLNGKEATDVVAGLGKMLAQATLKAAVLGEGPLAGLMGTTEGGGLMGGLKAVLSGLFSGGIPAVGKAAGGFIAGPGTGTSDEIPIWASNGEFMVNAKATAQNRGLLEAINTGRQMPAAPRGFAGGGIVTAGPESSGRNWDRGSEEAASGGRTTVIQNHFHITTPNPRAFAEDRVSVARGAARLVQQARRYM